MIQRITGQLPAWARRDHPVLRHELGRTKIAPRRVRLARAFGVVLLAALLLLIGYLVATDLNATPAGQNVVESLNNILYFPILIVQVILRIAAFTLTAGVVGEQVRFGKWDNLRATEHGAELTMRTRWASVFYRLRGLIGVVTVLRLILVGGILYDLTSFQGRHLDLFIVGITPEVPLVVAVLLLSFLMTASLLLPVTGTGFDASMGLLISSHVPGRTFGAMAQGLYILARMALTVVLVLAATAFLNNQLPTSDLGSWLLLLVFSAIGDWGVAFLFLSRFGEVWAIVPYGIFLGLGLLIFALLQAAAADAVLMLAARRAQRKG